MLREGATLPGAANPEGMRPCSVLVTGKCTTSESPFAEAEKDYREAVHVHDQEKTAKRGKAVPVYI